MSNKGKPGKGVKRVFAAVFIVLLAVWWLTTGSHKAIVDDLADSTGASASSSDFDTADGLEIPAYSADDVILRHIGYTSCYNQETLIPNWVAWELTAEEMNGDLETYRNYSEDPSLKGEQADNRDYVNSGYTHGHMAPVGDMKWSKQAIDESNYLVNMCPQTNALNAGDWEYLESRCRQLARKYGSICIVCGPVITSSNPRTIGRNDVVVPDAFFKVLLAKMNGEYKTIGFIYQNDDSRQMMADCAMSVDEVERITGIDFFPALPDDVENRIESEFNVRDWRY